MATQIIMPKWGMSMREGTVARWFKQEGQPVEAGETLLEIETEKMTNVVDAPSSGVLARVLVEAGSTVPVQELLAVITAPGEAVPDLPGLADAGAAPAAAAPRPASSRPAASAPAPGPSAGGIIPATPVARRLARERGLDLASVTGTGPRGTITREDVEAALSTAPPAAAAPSLPIQKLSFYSDGHRLDGLLYVPPGLRPAERRPTVVLCPGYTYIKSLALPDIARSLNAAGYAALIFDYRGFGDSEGPRFRLLPWEQVADVRAAVSCALDQAVVDGSRLAVLGLSLGGSHALTAAAVDPRIAAAVAIEPVGHGARWLRALRRHWEWEAFLRQLAQDRAARARSGRSARVDPLDIVLPDPASRDFLQAAYNEYPQMQCDVALESAEALTEYEPEQLVGRISPRPLLLIHGDADRMVPLDESRALLAHAGEPSQLLVLPGVGHFDWVLPKSPGFAEVVGHLLAFLRARLPVT